MVKRAQLSGGGPALSLVRVPTLVLLFLVTYFFGSMAMHLFHYNRSPGLVDDELGPDGELGADGELGTSSVKSPNQEGCDTIEAFIEDGDYQNSSAHNNAWRQMKWGLPPAKCRVNGLLIERLDPLYNYRRGVALGLTSDPDDKTHIEHWFLGTKVDLNQRKRRVYIDLGANYFQTSVVWFNQRYPCDFTEVHAFEADNQMFRLPAGFDEESNWLEPHTEGFRKIKGRDGFLPQWMIDRVHAYSKFAGIVDDIENNLVNITRFIKDELKLTADDAVVIKMDIEGSEWPILELWKNDPDLPKIIDELWVEVHYYHPPDNNWETVKDFTRDQTTRILAEMRYKGFYVHYWD